jgi:hypothetical protein
VIKALHKLREEASDPPYDSVFGVFESGSELYPGAALRSRTHMQIAVRMHNSQSNIVGYFRVPGLHLLSKP